MKTYIAQRLGIAVLTLFGMSIVIFVLLRLAPGDIVDVLFSAAGYVNPAEKKAILQELGMDKPVWQQYVDWITQIMRGDLGKSYRYDLPAWQIIRPLMPVTVELAILSTIVAVVLGVPTGVISAVRQDGALDYALRVFSLAGLSMPSFWLGDGDHPHAGVVAGLDPAAHLRAPHRELLAARACSSCCPRSPSAIARPR